ncbi:predicted thioesterase [Longilinea arvoryzae]|uniref:Predicted thioesterase n=1 Tax=Longilinea arvoryzae TaxID=360412 RepID=A0A0S7B5X8_9CHLR|nr:thioesterase family protein [Longilinea arvoryzae]GAP12543.1 predicted thioesterase [Longilinea arvoryzae]
MTEFRFYCPIQVRYGDLDAQWHVNNARFNSYIEQGRFEYLLRLGLFDGVDFSSLGLIVADVHITYLAPIEINHQVRVGVRTSRIGNKSLVFEYIVQDAASGDLFAKAETVMVAYDYKSRQSIPVSPEWRSTISTFEGVAF